jgi:uncharacterized Zn finger protein (UPF0148 family)
MSNYWYKTYIEYCPICGHEEKHKERQYSEKPININKLTEFKEVYDYCER